MFLSDSMASMERQEIFFEDSFRVIVSSHRKTFFGQKLRKQEGISQFYKTLQKYVCPMPIFTHKLIAKLFVSTHRGDFAPLKMKNNPTLVVCC